MAAKEIKIRLILDSERDRHIIEKLESLQRYFRSSYVRVLLDYGIRNENLILASGASGATPRMPSQDTGADIFELVVPEELHRDTE